jgi:glutamate 5-kinase
MSTKLVAARLATSAGVTTIITRSSNPGNISSIIAYLQPPGSSSDLASLASGPPPLHTRFPPSSSPIRSRHFWLLHGLSPHGTLYIDAGAYKALRGKAGLLPVGVVGAEGTFSQQEAVRLVVVDRHSGERREDLGEKGEVGRAIANYSAGECKRIRGVQSDEIEKVLGWADSEYVAERENVCLFERAPEKDV